MPTTPLASTIPPMKDAASNLWPLQELLWEGVVVEPSCSAADELCVTPPPPVLWSVAGAAEGVSGVTGTGKHSMLIHTVLMSQSYKHSTCVITCVKLRQDNGVRPVKYWIYNLTGIFMKIIQFKGIFGTCILIMLGQLREFLISSTALFRDKEQYFEDIISAPNINANCYNAFQV